MLLKYYVVDLVPLLVIVSLGGDELRDNMIDDVDDYDDDVDGDDVNPSRVECILGIIKIYLHFLPILNTEILSNL